MKINFTVVLVTLNLLLLLRTAGSEATGKGCVSGNPPFESQDLYYEYLKNRASNLLFIPEYKFACYGRVTQWGVFMPEHKTKLDPFKTYNIDFQVWRRERNGTKLLDCYQFVGSNYFPGFYTEKTGRFLGNVPKEQQIEVQPFDIIGVTVSKKMQFYTDTFVDQQTMWYSETKLTPIPSSTTVCLETDSDSNITPTDDFMPLITATVDTTEPPTNPPTVTMDTIWTNLVTTTHTTTNPVTKSTATPNPVTTVNMTTNPVTMVTAQTNPVTKQIMTTNPVTMATAETNPCTDTESPTSTSSPTSPPSVLGMEGVIEISVSAAGLLLLALIVLLVVVLACYRRKVLNRQFLATRPLPPIPHNRGNNIREPVGITDTDSESSDQEFRDQEREQLYIRRNRAYNIQRLPAVIPPVVNPVERINEDYSEDDGYERIPVPVCGSYERLY